MVKEARDRGLTAPVILMGEVMCPALVVLFTDHVGYYNPMLAYGEQKAIQDASEAGANGFIVVDLPPEEAVYFREKCATARWVIITTLVHCMTSRDQYDLCTSHRAFYDNSPYSLPHFYCGYLHLCCFQGKLIQSESLEHF